MRDEFCLLLYTATVDYFLHLAHFSDSSLPPPPGFLLVIESVFSF